LILFPKLFNHLVSNPAAVYVNTYICEIVTNILNLKINEVREQYPFNNYRHIIPLSEHLISAAASLCQAATL
jgi:hypothetical protein